MSHFYLMCIVLCDFMSRLYSLPYLFVGSRGQLPSSEYKLNWTYFKSPSNKSTGKTSLLDDGQQQITHTDERAKPCIKFPLAGCSLSSRRCSQPGRITIPLCGHQFVIIAYPHLGQTTWRRRTQNVFSDAGWLKQIPRNRQTILYKAWDCTKPTTGICH